MGKNATRLHINNVNLEKLPVVKILGIWLSEDVTWTRNCKEITIKAYSRLSMLTKLRYVGVSREDLLNISVLYIRSVTEYCSVAFHSRLTQEQSNKLERIQKTCLKVILREDYISYDSALEMCGLQTLYSRRENRCLDFALKCSKHQRNKRLFPLKAVNTKEKYVVNWARTETYKNSAIPYCQRLLNEHAKKK